MLGRHSVARCHNLLTKLVKAYMVTKAQLKAFFGKNLACSLVQAVVSHPTITARKSGSSGCAQTDRRANGRAAYEMLRC